MDRSRRLAAEDAGRGRVRRTPRHHHGALLALQRPVDPHRAPEIASRRDARAAQWADARALAQSFALAR